MATERAKRPEEMRVQPTPPRRCPTILKSVLSVPATSACVPPAVMSIASEKNWEVRVVPNGSAGSCCRVPAQR
jgi:hypothetical protein